MENIHRFIQICVLLNFLSIGVDTGLYKWMGYDRFDEMEEIYNSVDGDNCRAKGKSDLLLRDDLVTQIPKYNNLLSQVWYKNRTSLIHLHNMALNRAFFYSYSFQRLNETELFNDQPNWMYMYFSVAADVNANPNGINASAIYFDVNCSYPNWYHNVPFNTTLDLFAPKAWRWDDYNDQDNYLREPTKRTVAMTDVGAGRGSNYSRPDYKMNTWYDKWMPDIQGDMDSLTKFTYFVGIKYSEVTGKFTTDEFQEQSFIGPPSPGQEETNERMLPVTFTKPYFDCGVQDKWMVSATSPVIDFMPRYSNWTHLRRPRAVAVIAMDIDWDMIDFNSCGVSPGNPGPSYLSGIARCKKTTTCKFKPGHGFMRGGYVCVCKPGYRYPNHINPPYQGINIEQATDEEYKNGFQCTPVQHRQVLPLQKNPDSSRTPGAINNFPTLRSKRDVADDYSSASLKSRSLQSFNDSMDNDNMNMNDNRLKYKPRHQVHPEPNEEVVQAENAFKEFKPRKRKVKTPAQKLKFHTRRKRALTYDYIAHEKMMRIFRQKSSVSKENCHTLSEATKKLPGAVAYGVDSQFEVEGRTALRLAHFLSIYLQNTDPDENFGNLKGGGRLHMEHLFGEVVANVMGNHKIVSSGIFFDTNQFIYQDGSVKEYFGPLAFKKEGDFLSVDTAGFPKAYVHEDWFLTSKQRWITNTEALKTYKIRANIRSDPKGTSQIKFEHFPLRYEAPEYSDGFWTYPKFKCDDMVNDWVVTYVTPFFGWDLMKKKLMFKGVVTVDVPIDHLEINQCPQAFHVANAFKNTARCDLQSTNCRPMAGFKFSIGAYRCDCKEGFEYMHLDNKFWMEGSLVELEYQKKMRGEFNQFDDMRCRIAGGNSITMNVVLLLAVTLLTLVEGLNICGLCTY